MGASPTDRKYLAPVDLGEVDPWTRYIQNIFQVKHVDTISETRAPGTGLDLYGKLGVGYYNRGGQELRGAAAGNTYLQGKRGHMNRVPTAQALIRAITGIGDPPQGR